MAKTSKSTWFYLLAMGCAVAAAGLSVTYVTEARQETQIVVTTASLPAYAPITEKDVKVVSVPSMGVQADTYHKPEDVIGRYTAMSLEQDSPVRPGALAGHADRPAGVLASKDKDQSHVLVSVPLQKTDLGNGVHAGDYVNIVGILKEAQSLKTIHVPNLQVLNVDQGDKNGTAGPSLWLSVPKERSDDLHTAVAAGTIRCELLPKGEGN